MEYREHHTRDIQPIHDVIPIPSEYTGYIIGSKGRGISSLKQMSGVNKVWIGEQHVVHFRQQWSYLHFEGLPHHVDAAKCLTMERLITAARSGQKHG